MTTPFLGQVLMASFNFAPKGFALCNGQLLTINQNAALFSLLGTTYGGNGTTTFALPNLQSQLVVHQGNGFVMGQTGGAATVTIGDTTMPLHSHTFNATTASASAAAIGGSRVPGTPTAANASAYAVSLAPNPPLVGQSLAAGVCGLTGGSQPHSNLMPSLTINFCIALQGIFPSRN